MRSSSHTSTPFFFLPRQNQCNFALAAALCGGEQEVKGGRGQHSMMTLSAFGKAALSDIILKSFSQTCAVSKHSV